jgi:hypothetical protein
LRTKDYQVLNGGALGQHEDAADRRQPATFGADAAPTQMISVLNQHALSAGEETLLSVDAGIPSVNLHNAANARRSHYVIGER